ncbi:hypothetical protein ACFFJT_09170 [Dyella flava]|uniref:Uncharacterized protein n=1 Tax=Dyella flava TaxID=1920170 RepID=A0ABS2KBL4_9GAMM|nr:hypothetical protein [Dyella flava]MBM7127763.1 hypothetical protein [Dyella flava]
MDAFLESAFVAVISTLAAILNRDVIPTLAATLNCDVIPTLAATLILAVIPAKAGIHFEVRQRAQWVDQLRCCRAPPLSRE